MARQVCKCLRPAAGIRLKLLAQQAIARLPTHHGNLRRWRPPVDGIIVRRKSRAFFQQHLPEAGIRSLPMYF